MSTHAPPRQPVLHRGILTAMRAFIARHPVPAYFAVVFAISVGGGLIVMAPGGLPGTKEQTERLLPIAFLLLFAGPSVAGLLLTGLVHGRAGYRDLRARLLTWRVGARWYAAALLIAPLSIAASHFSLALFSRDFLPAIAATDGKAALLLSGLAVGLGGGLVEELGWTGFAIPALRRRHGVLATGLIAGALWGAWHILITYWTTGDPALGWPSSLALFLPVYLVCGAGGLMAFRVLMVWVYDRTESLLVAILMHASLIVCNIYLLAPAVTGADYVTFALATTVALWLLVAAMVVATRGRMRRPERPTATRQRMARPSPAGTSGR